MAAAVGAVVLRGGGLPRGELAALAAMGAAGVIGAFLAEVAGGTGAA
ncbi:MAG: hypothetical protein JWP28_1306, partial [Phenylobacterium sp.]|nr:hypothetical protein [Phenylobacterium sp.]